MLVLNRKRAERLVMAGGIVVTVLEIQGDRVKLGIEAPQEVTIVRQEVLDRARTVVADPVMAATHAVD